MRHSFSTQGGSLRNAAVNIRKTSIRIKLLKGTVILILFIISAGWQTLVSTVPPLETPKFTRPEVETSLSEQRQLGTKYLRLAPHFLTENVLAGGRFLKLYML